MATTNRASPDEAGAAKPEPFVDRMFSGFLHGAEVTPSRTRPLAEEPYRPLHQMKADPGMTYRLLSPTRELRVQANSPATDVMTDLSRVVAITTTAGATVDAAHQEMIKHGVRALFIIDKQGKIRYIDVHPIGDQPKNSVLFDELKKIQ